MIEFFLGMLMTMPFVFFVMCLRFFLGGS